MDSLCQWLTERLFNEIKDNSLHKLHGLLPPGPYCLGSLIIVVVMVMVIVVINTSSCL